jgi:hypothetical protein
MEEISKYLASAHRAAIGNITDNTRAVVLGCKDKMIHLKFITVNSPSETDRDVLGFMGTEILADFPDHDIKESIEYSNQYPKFLLDDNHKYFIFFRYEVTND